MWGRVRHCMTLELHTMQLQQKLTPFYHTKIIPYTERYILVTKFWIERTKSSTTKMLLHTMPLERP